jgi:nicotinate phosphoribosyltransferase
MAASALASLLDNDLYKFTMQHAVLQHYRNTQVTYQFTNREKNLHLNEEAVAWLKQQIQGKPQLELIQLITHSSSLSLCV